jgi:spore germination protein YaaH
MPAALHRGVAHCVLLAILASTAVAFNVQAVNAAYLEPRTDLVQQRSMLVPDPKIGPNAADEARHARDAKDLPPATSMPIPLHPLTAGRLAASPLTVTQAPTPFHREVFGFAPYWSISQYGTWNYTLLSTVAFFGLTVDGAGNFDTAAPGWNQWNSQELVNTINNAHAAGDKAVVVIKQFNEDTINRLVTDPALSQVTITNTINAIAAKNLDGVNVDFEGQTGGPYIYIQGGMTHFMTMLSTQVHARWPNAEVSIDTYTGSASWDGGIFKIGDLAPVVDAMFVMAYDMPFDNLPGRAAANAPMTGYTYNDTLTVSQYITKAPASKVILGVPYYGYKWSTTGNDPNAIAYNGAMSDTYANIVSELACHPQYMAQAWDSVAQSPWVSWYSPATNDPCEGNYGHWRELYYDNVQSLGLKYDLVNQNDLRGAGMWALGYDGGATELWNAIAQKLTTVTRWDPLNGLTTSDPAVAAGTNRLDVFILGADNAAWQQTWNGTQWLGWQSLGGIATSGPAAVAPAAGRLDMFVRGSDKALWHRWWNGTAWQPWESIGGNLTSGPDAASWSATRMDVFARGSDNALWHRSWNGTGWLAWESLGGVLASDPASVAYTSGRLDVFVRGTDNQLWHLVYDTGGWGTWQALGGNLVSAPAAASCGVFRLDVFAVHSDRALWRRSLTQVGWGDWQSLGGQWASGPAAACRPGASAIDVFERAQDGAVWHSPVT